MSLLFYFKNNNNIAQLELNIFLLFPPSSNTTYQTSYFNQNKRTDKRTDRTGRQAAQQDRASKTDIEHRSE